MSGDNYDITVNGQPTSIPVGCTVEGLLSQLEIMRRRVAVAVNHDVVPRGSYPETKLTAGDQIEILEAVGGG